MDYQNLISKRVQSVPPSGIRKYFDLLDDNYISLGVGEPDFPTPKVIRAAAADKLLTGKGRVAYTSNSGEPRLRELILRYLTERIGIKGYESIDDVLITVGASQAIDLAMRAILDPEDEVVVHDPAYVSYIPSIEFTSAKAVVARTTAEDRFRLRPEALKKALSKKTKALLLAYPTNPTGAIMEQEDLEALADVIRDTDIVVITDEIYCELTFNGKRHVSFASLPGMRERTIVLNGFSKAFSMTGWRLGYAAGQKDLIAAMRKVHQLTMLCAPTIAQWGGVAALEDAFSNGFARVEEMMANNMSGTK